MVGEMPAYRRPGSSLQFLRPVLRIAASFAIVGNVGLTTAAQQVPDEYRLKAAFIYHFPQFVEWPPTALEGRATVDLCVLDPNPFGGVLEDLAEGEALAGRPLAVRRVDVNATDNCQVLYLPGSVTNRKVILQRVSRLPVLTVSDAPEFLDEGGTVLLRVVSNRVRFEVNVGAAETAGLRISPQLLRLALRVRGGGQS
jgi:hypothetical protein